MLTTHSVCSIGKNATFQCLSPLETCANITWHRGREPLEPPIAGHAYPAFRDKYIMSDSVLGCQLIIRNAELSDTGPYTCRFMNSFQVTTELYVLGKLYVYFTLFYMCMAKNVLNDETSRFILFPFLNWRMEVLYYKSELYIIREYVVGAWFLSLWWRPLVLRSLPITHSTAYFLQLKSVLFCGS